MHMQTRHVKLELKDYYHMVTKISMRKMKIKKEAF
jgi:hypothetical protein